MHVGRWGLQTPSYEPGAWLRGTIYPQRCDLSPDGRWLAYFAMKQAADWDLGATYIAISRLPWLTALAAWGIGSTWTRGMHFVDDASVREVGDPDLGDLRTVYEPFGLRMSSADSFERRRGWTETAETAPRDVSDAWDEARGDRIVIEAATGLGRLGAAGRERHVRGDPGAPRHPHGRPLRAPPGDTATVLEDAQWADWDASGRLLGASRDGRLQIREGTSVVWEADEGSNEPDPAPPPEEASAW